MTTFSDSSKTSLIASVPASGVALRFQCPVTVKRRSCVGIAAESMPSRGPRKYVIELAKERPANQLQNEKSLAWCLAASRAKGSRIPLKAFYWAVKRAALMLGREPDRTDLEELGADLSVPLTTLAAVRAKEGDPETLDSRWQEATKSIAELFSHPRWKARPGKVSSSVPLDAPLNTGRPRSTKGQKK